MKNLGISSYIISLLLYGIISCMFSCAHKSGRHGKEHINRRGETTHVSEDHDTERRSRKVGGHTKVRMRKEGGVYLVPIVVNGLNLDFIFDTGASSISLSLAEAIVMERQGKITQDDVVGKAQYSDANGDVSVGTVIMLKTVKIGEITLENIEASVVDNIEAPLLLGQTALAKFGKVTIDYENNTIEFN